MPWLSGLLKKKAAATGGAKTLGGPVPNTPHIGSGSMFGGAPMIQRATPAAGSGMPVSQLAPGTASPYGTIQTGGNTAALGDRLTGAIGNLGSPTLSTGRAAMVKSAMDDFDLAGRDRLHAGFQDVGRRSAALGRGGSGMTSQAVGNVQSAYNRDRLLTQNELLRGAAERDVDDRFRTVDTLMGARGQQYGMDTQERGYQYGLTRDAVGDARDAAITGDMLHGNAWNRAAGAASFGNPNAAAGYYQGASQQAAGRAGDYYDAAGGMLGDWLYRRNGAR